MNEKINKLVSIDIIKKRAEEYAKKEFGIENIILFDPIFRKDNGNEYLGFAVLEMVDEVNKNYYIKRPTKWLLVDIITGDFVVAYDCNENDYTNKDSYPFKLLIENNGNSKLYDSSNYILMSFFNWKNNIIKEVEEKFAIQNDDFKNNVLRLNNETISANSFVLANIDPILENLYKELGDKIGSKINELYEEYYIYCIDEIRKSYILNGNIDTLLLANYIDLLLYSWPEYKEFINKFNNINN